MEIKHKLFAQWTKDQTEKQKMLQAKEEIITAQVRDDTLTLTLTLTLIAIITAQVRDDTLTLTLTLTLIAIITAQVRDDTDRQAQIEAQELRQTLAAKRARAMLRAQHRRQIETQEAHRLLRMAEYAENAMQEAENRRAEQSLQVHVNQRGEAEFPQP